MTAIPARFSGAIALVALLVSGCATLDSVSGSATMRIDVEVYKGPLAQDPWTQFGELLAAVREANTALARFSASFENWRKRKTDCPPSPSSLFPFQENAPPDEPLFKDSGVSRVCQYLGALAEDARSLREPEEVLENLRLELTRLDFGNNVELSRQSAQRTLSRVVEAATRLRAKAYFWAGTQVADPSVGSIWLTNRYLRSYMVTFGFAASEYANQIVTRADALLQQIAGPDRRELPLSVHLRNTNPSDFLNLYIWNRAGGLALLEDWFLRPDAAFSGTETADRVRGYERLFGDYNWSNVNTVYASGQGDVGMAFVKDDIGNWNLKSFDNDPAELLKSYTNLGKAAIAAAISLAGKASGADVTTAVDGASKLTELANRVAFGRTAAPQATVGGLDVNAVHARVKRDISALEAEAKAEEASLRREIPAVDDEIKELDRRAEAARQNSETERAREYETQSAERVRDNQARKAKLRDLVKTYAGKAKLILDRHAAVIDLLQQGVATPSASPQPPAR